MTNKIIDFNIMRINKNAQKICRCDPPNYEIDTTNRLVQCTKCGAYIHPFDALVGLAENIEKYNSIINKLEEEMIEMADERNEYAKEVNTLLTKRFRMNVFRDLQNSYMKGLMPRCPHCERAFDPTEIDHYTNKDYCDYKRKKSREEEIDYILKYKNLSLVEYSKEWDILETYTDEELDKEIGKIKERLGDD